MSNEMTREEAKGNLMHAIRWNDIPKKEALDMAIKALEAEPCKDAISRQAALDCFTATKMKKFDFILYAREEIKNLPPVQPIRPRGHWIDRSEGGRIKYPWMESNECSECGENGSAAWYYCPHCGADMREEQK